MRCAVHCLCTTYQETFSAVNYAALAVHIMTFRIGDSNVVLGGLISSMAENRDVTGY